MLPDLETTDRHSLPSAAPSPSTPVCAVQSDLMTLTFDQAYVVGQELGIAVGDEMYLYQVQPDDVEAELARTQANVARGVLAALVNGGFRGFSPSGVTLSGNSLTLISPRVLSQPPAPAAGLWAACLWSN